MQNDYTNTPESTARFEELLRWCIENNIAELARKLAVRIETQS